MSEFNQKSSTNLERGWCYEKGPKMVRHKVSKIREAIK